MGSDSGSTELKCDLCRRSVENEITGPLAKKADVLAHQNCLLYAAAIICKKDPAYDDLFGFEVDDVKAEVKRGAKLKCGKCKKMGATAGCEERRCHRSYHYPCAIESKAKTVEKKERYMLFCLNHYPNNETPERSKNSKSKKPSSGASDVHNSNSGDNDTNASYMENRHAGPKSEFRTPSSGRKRKRILDLSDDEEPCSIDPICAPLDSDLEDNTIPVQHEQSGTDTGDKSLDEEPIPSTSGFGLSVILDSDDSDVDHDSKSLLPSEYRQENVPVTVITDSGPSDTSPGTISPNSSSPPTLDASVSTPTHFETANFNNDKINPPSSALPSSIEPPSAKDQQNPNPVNQHLRAVLQIPRIDKSLATPCKNKSLHTMVPAEDSSAPTQATESLGEEGVSDCSAALLWRRFNEGGYTEYIFSDLKHQLSDLAERVQNQSATEQDYNISLRILEASGRIPTIFKQLSQDLDEQERKLSRKRVNLRDASEALGQNYLI